jgi:glycerol-3-phosphate dehydrogenase subunit C
MSTHPDSLTIDWESSAPFQSVELSLDQCIKCNICVTKCPVSAVTDLFPGPKFEGPQAGRFRQINQPTPDQSVDYCSGCRVCNMACPTGVKIAEINARARARLVEAGKISIKRRLRNNIIARSELLGKVGQPLSTLANAALSSPIVRKVIEAGLDIHQKAPLPAFAKYRFSSWFRQHDPPKGLTRKVVYFHGCSTEYYEPHVGRAAVHVLEANGFEVIVPPQNCCSLPLLSNGEFRAARKYHNQNIQHLLPYTNQSIPIVGTSTSCTLTLKEEAPELLGMNNQEARLVAQNVFDINEFLLGLLDEGILNYDLKPLPFTMVYHAPCQYRAHRLGKPALEIMKLIPKLELLDSHADCCGIAGTYGYKVEKYQISMDVGHSLFEFVRKANGPITICDSETCRWQITHATQTPTVHPIELLSAAYGYEPEGPLADILE